MTGSDSGTMISAGDSIRAGGGGVVVAVAAAELVIAVAVVEAGVSETTGSSDPHPDRTTRSVPIAKTLSFSFTSTPKCKNRQHEMLLRSFANSYHHAITDSRIHGEKLPRGTGSYCPPYLRGRLSRESRRVVGRRSGHGQYEIPT